MTTRLIFIALGLTMGNFAYQELILVAGSAAVAAERSFFQAFALYAVWVITNLSPPKDKP